MTCILLIEDNQDLATGLIDNLILEGYKLVHTSNGDDALPSIQKHSPDLIILDMMLPNKTGFEILNDLKKINNQTPVLCLSARSEEIDKVRALRSGAEDYVTKPFGLMELISRIQVLLKRRQKSVQPSDTLYFGDIIINNATHEVFKNNIPVNLSPKEFELLTTLLHHKNTVLSRQFLLEKVWGYNKLVVSRTIDSHIAELRKKLEDDQSNPCYILTVRKLGYRLQTIS